MKPASITFKEFTKKYIRNFPDQFRYYAEPIQIYNVEKILAKNITTPTPLLNANFNFIALPTNGNIQQQIGNEIKKVSKNEAVLVMQGELTSLIKKSPNIKGYYIIFEDKVLQQFREHSHFMKLFTVAPIIQLNSKDSKFLVQVCKLIIAELETKSHNAQIVLYLFQSILLKLLNSSALKNALSRQFDIAISFRKLVFKHYLEHYSINDYARLLNISANYLNRCIQSVWNKSAKQFTQEFIIIQSQKELQDFSKSVSSVAYSFNFNDPSYFGRLFKKIIGVSAQQYRLKLMHGLS